MSEQKLSEEMRATLPDIMWSVSRVRTTVHGWADEVATLEAKLEAWRRTVDSYVNGDGTDRDLECALENGPLTDSEIVAAYGSDLDAAQEEQEE